MRRGLLREAVTGIYRRHGTIAEADCLVGFSFGYRTDGDRPIPGTSNTALASVIAQSYLALPLILQWEVSAALSPQPEHLWRIERHARRRQYLDTHEVARQALGIMREHDYATALILAHPHHIARANAVCLRLGMKTVVPDGLEQVGFDSKSEQPWTRRQPSWSVHETLALAYYNPAGRL